MQAKRSELISTIYAATLAPEGFDELVDNLEAQVVALIEEVTGIAGFGTVLPHSQTQVVDPDAFADLAAHIEKAYAIQTRIGHASSRADRLDLVVELVPNPAFIVDGLEQVVRANAAARRKEAGVAATLGDLFPDAAEFQRIRDGIAILRDGRDFVSIPISVDLAEGLNSCALIKRLDDGRPATARDSHYLVTVVDFGFDADVGSMFRDTYDLTDAEAAVAVMLASGINTAEIAARRSVSLATVRSQIKAIKQKTRVRDLPDLVRLLCGFSAGILVPNNVVRSAELSSAARLQASIRTMRLSDGRNLDYIEQGDPAGEPVLLLHNMPYGLVLPSGAARFARTNSLRIIAPFRAGHAGSDPLPGLTREALLDRVAVDHLELLDHLGLERVQILGNCAGSTYGIRFAHTFPDRVSRIVLVSRAPIWRGEWLVYLPQRQRLISTLLRFMPRLANILVWAMLSYVTKSSAEDFLRSSLKESRSDLAALDNPETVRLLASGIEVGLLKGVEGFCKDWELMEIDLTHEAQAISHPIHVVHGSDDQIIRADFSRRFVECVPRATLDVVEGAGNMLFYSHWRHVMEPLVSLRREDGTGEPGETASGLSAAQ